MQPGFKLFSERRVNGPLLGYPAHADEFCRYDADIEMRLTARRCAGMSGMAGAIIDNL